MFKGARWRGEKNKTKVGFRLQFHATQVPQIGWETMVVTLVPMDVGKPTVRSEKAAVDGGECRWIIPIKEYVKLVKDPKTGKTNEKIYRFLVSATRSAKCGFLGEISINLADYAEVTKPSTVSLPLKAPSSGVILHVTIQRVQADLDGSIGREPDGRKITAELANCDEEEGDRAMTTNASKEDYLFVKNYAQLIFPPGKIESPRAKCNGALNNSSSTEQTSVSGSDSSSGQYTPQKPGTNNAETDKDTATFLLSIKNKGIPRKEINGLIDLVKDYRDHWNQRLNSEQSVDAPANGSMDWSTGNSAETSLTERSQNPDSSAEKHCSDDVALARQLEVLELELQTLRKQVLVERRRGQDASLEISDLKEERDALTSKFEELEGSQVRIGKENVSSWSQLNGEDLQSLLREIKQELDHEKNMSANLRLQLQKTQESNNELILEVQDLDQLLEQRSKDMTCSNCSIQATRTSSTSNAFPEDESRIALISHSQSSKYQQELSDTTSEDDEQRALETLMKEHDRVAADYSLEQKIIDLNSEIDLCKKDNEDLEMQMEQLALDYEILKQENHTMTLKLEQTQMHEQLQMQYECSAHQSIISDLETQVMSLEKELDEQADTFEADIEVIARGKIEQEQRAIKAEEALRNTKSRTAKTADQLKEDFERLSSQISSTYNINENLASQALKEADELRSQKRHLQELLEKTSAELLLLQEQYGMKHQELSDLVDLKTKEADKLLMELKVKSDELENAKLSQESRQKAFSEDIAVLRNHMQMLSREKEQLLKEIERKEVLLSEMEQLKTSVGTTERLLQERILQCEMLDMELSSTREEARKSLEENNNLKQLKDEKDALIIAVNSEVQALKEEYSELKRSLSEVDLENEDLRKLIFKLRGELKKKEDTITSMDKKLKEANARVAATDGTAKTALKNKYNKSTQSPAVSKELTSLREKIKLLEGKIKVKDDDIENTKYSFMVKETELSNRIEELERSINQSETGLSEATVYKGIDNLESANGDKGSIYDISSMRGDELNTSEEGSKSTNNGHANLDELIDEMENLKDKNKFMELELKEMNERYSDISLKFAELDGEREQLVMVVRSLKSALKN